MADLSAVKLPKVPERIQPRLTREEFLAFEEAARKHVFRKRAQNLLVARDLAIHELLGPDHPDTATSLNNLGGLLQDQGDLAAARPYLERALAMLRERLGEGHPSTLTVHNNLQGLGS